MQRSHSIGSDHRMNVRDFERERTTLEDALKAKGLGFTAAYLAVHDLQELIRTHPKIIRSETIQALDGVLKNSGFSRETQSFFLYKEAADALTSIIVHTIAEPLAEEAFSALKTVLGTASGDPQRAVANALGSLPISICGPKVSEETIEDVPRVKWEEILEEKGITKGRAPELIGRSLVVPIDEKNRLLVVKLARSEHSLQHIHREAVWMNHLCSWDYPFPVRFDIPVAIKIQGSYVFRLENTPLRMREGMDLHPEGYAIGFIAHKDYFAYPNEHRTERRLTMEGFREVIFRNAWLLGKLTFLGIVHSAPIALFHNRIQRDRRTDQGLYEWPRGGRLDRWLDSCSYPNFGVTGIRDFEHLIAFKGLSEKLYRHIGTQIFSLWLVVGSYFRNKDRGRVGLDGRGNPMDARDLFDKEFLKELVQGVSLSYYHGFVGTELTGKIPLAFDELTCRMIDEMGVDRHMEEILRVADQERMSDEEFRRFLGNRGYSRDEIKGFKRGDQDITVYTGPHLGGFNERISIPELIESVGAMSALCIAGRYRRENFSF
jgi:hypothetical protein